MAFVLEKFLFVFELQLAGIICAWWGMILSALSIVGIVVDLLFENGHSFNRFLPFHVNTGSALFSGIVAIILCLLYFYFSYQLLLGSQSGNASQMFGYLIIHGIVVILFILMAFKSAFSLLAVIIYCYLWFCVYSLYVKTGGSFT